MLSYRHAFHAGNHADVLKHFVLFLILTYFKRKDKPFWYVDTHSGAGLYDLQGEEAGKVGEYVQGIKRLQQAIDLPDELVDFVAFMRASVPDARFYAGSPRVAQAALRADDRLRLFELHPTDFRILTDNVGADGRCVVRQEDGFAGLKAVLPPPVRRAVVLMDPPYEDKRDYAKVVAALQAAHRRFATGCYVLWYPCLSREESVGLPQALQKAFPTQYLQAELHVHAPRADGFGMHGSGLWVINPPFVLDDILRRCLPVLLRCLRQDDAARYVLQSRLD